MEDNQQKLEEKYRAEVEASRALIRVAKSVIDFDIYNPAGERLERAFMAYDEALGLKPDEVPS